MEGHVAVRGARLWTEVSGDGTAVVLLHGGPGVSDYTGPLAALLPARVHRFEQRGCGRSEAGPEPVTLDAVLADLDALLDHWGLDACVLAGHSFGGALALLYALARPARATGLLYLNGMGIELGWEGQHRLEMLRRLAPADRERYERLLRARDAAASGAERDRLATEAFLAALAADLPDPRHRAALGDLRVRRELNGRLNAEWAERVADPALCRRVRGLAVPALVVQGARDTRPNGPARRLADALPLARYVELESAGHFPWLDDPDALVRVVAPFLADPKTSASSASKRR